MTEQPPHHSVYLLTGGAGFIGSHLAEKLLTEGHRVVIIDDLSTGKYSNIEHLERDYGRNGRLKFIFDSVLHERVVEELVRESDRIFHLASAVGVQLIMDQPVRTLETIIGGTEVVLRCAARYRRQTMIFSSSEVYGKSEDVPFREDGDRLEGPTNLHRWAYACAKAMDEFLALAHWKQTRLPVTIARLFNTVGPRQTGHYGMVLPRFVESALLGEPLHVYGTGDQTRCFCHVDDVTDAVVRLMEEPRALGEVFNIGSQEEISIRGLAEQVIAATDSPSEVHQIPYEEAYGSDGFEDMQRRVPCLDKIRNLIGWEPRKSLVETIADVVEEMRGRGDGSPC